MSSFYDKLQNSFFWRFLLRIQEVVMAVATISVILVFGVVVLARYVFKINILGYDEVILLGACWMYFIGASYAMSEESHIKADILNLFLSQRKMAILHIIIDAVQVVIGIILLVLSYDMIIFDIITKPTSIDLEIPIIFSRLAIPTGFVLMTFYSVVYLARDIVKCISNK